MTDEQRNAAEEDQPDPSRLAEIDAMDHDRLLQERERLEKAQGDLQRRAYRVEFWASLMKGVTVIALALLILCITLGVFIQNFIWFGITAAVIMVAAFIITRFLKTRAKRLRAEKNRLRLECSAVYDRLDRRHIAAK
ncbi:MAG: hypothetical protein SPL65_05310 [Lachnospiraceae bacterium]|nr:hypothetical protein [Lachnospiraceae bacterium]